MTNKALFETLENNYLETPEDENEPPEDTRDGSEFDGFEYEEI